MQISDNKVVTIDYTLTSDEGEILDTSNGRKPLSYIQGVGAIIPGLEKACAGKVAGDSFKIAIEPAEGYGEYIKDLVVTLTKDKFEGTADLAVGMQFQTQTEYGVQVFSIIGIEGDNVQLDGNHPLAGKNLNFDVKINDVREATKEELEHGHVHQ